MLPATLERIDATLLQKICDDKTVESITLDFKRQLPTSSEGERREFLKDVCAMANSSGGDLVFGIAEVEGSAANINAITTESHDDSMRRLGQLIDSCVEPRLPGIAMKSVPVEGGYVLVVRIQQSLVGPHRFVLANHARFPIRSGVHSTDMSYDQLRTAFDRTSTLIERAARFRSERLQAIIDLKVWRTLVQEASAVVQLIPLSSVTAQKSIDLERAEQELTRFSVDWGSVSKQYNLEGLFLHQAVGDDPIPAYTQVYRSGALEFFTAYISSHYTEDPTIASQSMADFFFKAIDKAIGAARDYVGPGPAILGLSVINVQNHVLAVNTPFNLRRKPKADRNHFILPEYWIEDIATATSKAITPGLMDTVWQAFGLGKCSYFDAEGNFKAK